MFCSFRCLLVELEKLLRYLFIIQRFALGTKRPLMTIFSGIAANFAFG